MSSQHLFWVMLYKLDNMGQLRIYLPSIIIERPTATKLVSQVRHLPYLKRTFFQQYLSFQMFLVEQIFIDQLIRFIVPLTLIQF